MCWSLPKAGMAGPNRDGTKACTKLAQRAEALGQQLAQSAAAIAKKETQLSALKAEHAKLQEHAENAARDLQL